MDYKVIISAIAVILTFVGYVPYINDILKKKTKPHVFTWFIASFAGYTAWALQILGGAGVGSWALFTASTACLLIFILSLRIGDKDITRSDILFLILSLVALFLWLVVKQPVWSAILINLVEVIGFIPTIRKSWNKPYSETLFTYEICVVRHGLSIFALQKFNILTAMSPVAWVITNIAISAILIVRRMKIPRNGDPFEKPQRHIA